MTRSADVPELRLVALTALRHAAHPALDAAIADVAGRITDWNRVTEALRHHGTLLPFNHHAARLGLADRIPAPIRGRLAFATSVLRTRNLRFTDELKRLAAAFGEAGLHPVWLKGAGLVAAGLHGPDERFMEDLDAWVPPAALAPARDLLGRMGYRETGSADRNRVMGETSFRHPVDAELRVELSTRLNKNDELRGAYPLPDPDPDRDTTEHLMDGVLCRTLEREHRYVHALFHHVALHYLYRLNWLDDLHRMRRDPVLDLARASSLIAASGLTRCRDLVDAMLIRHWRIEPDATPGPLPSGLRSVFLGDSCLFADLAFLETRNASLRLAMIATLRGRVGVAARKLLPGPRRLRAQYGGAAALPALYGLHYRATARRWLNLR